MSGFLLYAVHGSRLAQLPAPKSARDVHELMQDLPAGVYSALRSYHGNRLLSLDAHLTRSQRCIERAGWKVCFDRDELCEAIDVAARVYAGDFRMRFDFLEHPISSAGEQAQIFMALAPHTPVPEHILRVGAHLALAPDGLRRRDPLIKFTSWVAERRICEQGANAYEYLLVDGKGHILEGISSNFFGVSGQTLLTSPDGVLEGITARLVIELAQARGFAIEYQRVSSGQLGQLDEAFITSSTREIVPVRSIAGTPIGAAKAGPIVAALRRDYSEFADTHSVPAITR